MSFFRPQPILTLFTLLGLWMLITLGNWQVQRLEWKQGLIATVEARIHLAPVPLEQALANGTVEEIAYTPVTLQGRYDHSRELHLFGRNDQGRVGYYIYTPLLRAGASSVIVNRGFVPERQMDLALRQAGQIEGMVTVTGLARGPSARGNFQPENNPATNEWYFRDLAAMAATMGEANVAPVFVDQELWDIPGGLPQGGQTRIHFPNDHLSYALTWYGLAIILIGVYIAFHISNGRLAPQLFRRRSKNT